MSSHLGYKQTVNVDRRTWDKEAYEKRAKARLAFEKDGRLSNTINSDDSQSKFKEGEKGEKGERGEEKEEFIPAVSGSAGPGISKRAYLKSRQKKVDLESKVGDAEIISTEALVKPDASNGIPISDGVSKSATGVGWHCKVCDCFLKDSHTYLDHINGRKHQRNLGYSMRVERSTADEVRKRMADLAAMKNANEKKKITLSSIHNASGIVGTNKFEDLVKAKDEERLARKAERARKREARKQKREAEENVEDEYEIPSADDMAAVMGFSGFK